MRFLDGEDQTLEAPFNCTVRRGEPARVEVGEIARDGVRMVSTCEGFGGRIDYGYVVGPDGEILSSSEWLGPGLGTVNVLHLRK